VEEQKSLVSAEHDRRKKDRGRGRERKEKRKPTTDHDRKESCRWLGKKPEKTSPGVRKEESINSSEKKERRILSKDVSSETCARIKRRVAPEGGEIPSHLHAEGAVPTRKSQPEGCISVEWGKEDESTAKTKKGGMSQCKSKKKESKREISSERGGNEGRLALISGRNYARRKKTGKKKKLVRGGGFVVPGKKERVPEKEGGVSPAGKKRGDLRHGRTREDPFKYFGYWTLAF